MVYTVEEMTLWASEMELVVKNLPANAGDAGDPDWEDPLEEGMATHSSILALRIPWTEEPDRLQAIGSSLLQCKPPTLTFHEIHFLLPVNVPKN